LQKLQQNKYTATIASPARRQIIGGGAPIKTHIIVDMDASLNKRISRHAPIKERLFWAGAHKLSAVRRVAAGARLYIMP